MHHHDASRFSEAIVVIAVAVASAHRKVFQGAGNRFLWRSPFWRLLSRRYLFSRFCFRCLFYKRLLRGRLLRLRRQFRCPLFRRLCEYYYPNKYYQGGCDSDGSMFGLHGKATLIIFLLLL
jgi:hypothetical protein